MTCNCFNLKMYCNLVLIVFIFIKKKWACTSCKIFTSQCCTRQCSRDQIYIYNVYIILIYNSQNHTVNSLHIGTV